MPELPDPAPTDPALPLASGRLTCEFCGCELSPSSGQFKKLSARAKELRNLEDVNETQARQLAESRTTIETLTRERDEARAALQRVPTNTERELFAR